MRRITILAIACALAFGAVLSAQQADAVKAAADALGAATIKTLQVSGSGANFSVGQNFTPAEPWPRVTIKTYTASINYDTGSMRRNCSAKWGRRCRAAAGRRSPANSVRFKWSAGTTPGIWPGLRPARLRPSRLRPPATSSTGC